MHNVNMDNAAGKVSIHVVIDLPVSSSKSLYNFILLSKIFLNFLPHIKYWTITATQAIQQ